VEGGVVICGKSTNDTTLYFTVVNGEGAYFCLFGVELRYGGQMNSVVYVGGGTIRFDSVKMDKQDSSHWVNPLIDVNATASAVYVYILSTTITNSDYRNANTSTTLYKSGVVFFVNTSTKVITLSMRESSFLIDSFYLSNDSYAASRGSVCQFHGPAQSGLFFIFYIFVLVFEFLFI
jgi:hypothetical protein